MSTRPLSIWPVPPPREPRRTPWQPAPQPPAPLPAIPPRRTTASRPSVTIVEPGQDWLAERLLEQRMVILEGKLDSAAANHAAASLALLDASGDDPIGLWLCDVEADLDIALTLVDTVDLVGVPLHATCLGKLSGAAVAILAVADRRAAGRHVTVHLREPRTQLSGHAGNVITHVEDHRRRLRLLQERIARACARTVDGVAADMQKGRILSAEQACGYGLVDEIADDWRR
jgi:ATP-dependent Clp protease, protease subunit